jgi:hypothetical protein
LGNQHGIALHHVTLFPRHRPHWSKKESSTATTHVQAVSSRPESGNRVGLPFRNPAPRLERVATLTGTVIDSLEKASEMIDEMAGARLGETLVQRTSEEAGRRLPELVQPGTVLGGRVVWPCHKDYRGPRCATSNWTPPASGSGPSVARPRRPPSPPRSPARQWPHR